jgi:hypothetical protein
MITHDYYDHRDADKDMNIVFRLNDSRCGDERSGQLRRGIIVS